MFKCLSVNELCKVHGNGVQDPARVTQMVDETRKLPSYRGQPIVFNEDDHFDFSKPQNNMLAALRAYSSWGYFDYRMTGERFDNGYSWTRSSLTDRGSCGAAIPIQPFFENSRTAATSSSRRRRPTGRRWP